MNVDNLIVKLRDEGQTWTEIAEQVDLHPITVAGKYTRATEPKARRVASPARVRKDRDGGMTWARVAARYDITKAKAKALYASTAAA